MKTLSNFLVVTVLMIYSTVTSAQSTITGKVIDANLNSPLSAANITEQGTSNKVTTDFEGNFSLTTLSNSGKIVISYKAYKAKTIDFSGNLNLGSVLLNLDHILEEVAEINYGIINLASDRKTPVAVSTISADEIQNKIGAQDITTTLVNTPSVYIAGQSVGFGDSRISIRGFGQSNIAYLLNGQPINRMEDSRMLWANWYGVNDIANGIEIQRGLGASKLGVSSVGGTVNFITKTTDKKESGYIYTGIANDDYIKNTVQYNTGKNIKGWSANVLLSYWRGDGYNDGTFGQGQTYFLSIGYTPNDNHNFNVLITGAPQWHDRNFSKSISDYLTYGRRYNENWGTYRGQYLTSRRAFYHKPVANLNWGFKINNNSKLSTILYASWGRGGDTGPRGNGATTLNGQVDYDAIYAQNANITNGDATYLDSEPAYITRSSMNLHNRYGIVSNFETNFNDNITFNIGIDLRTYYGAHFMIVEDFHGLKSWRENIRLRDQNNHHNIYGGFGTYKFVQTTRDLSANPWSVLFADFNEDEKIAYNYDERISYGGIFTQLEYSKNNLSAFFQGAISNQYHQRFDHYQYADQALIDGTSHQNTLDSSGNPIALPAGITDGVDSEKVDNFGFNIKGGVGYTISKRHKIYANAGYYSRQPFHENIWSESTNEINRFAENEKIFGLDIGYSFKSPFFSANLNLYSTNWKGRVGSTTNTDNYGSLLTTLSFGQEQIHKGIELDIITKPLTSLKVKGFLSIGDWVYVGETIQQTRDEAQNITNEIRTNVDGGKVGDAAQFTVGLGFDYQILNRLSLDADWRLYDELYASVGAIKENLELPSYDIVDLGISYQMIVGNNKDKSLNFRANINNLFYEVYLSDLRTANFVEANDETWNGINTSNRGYFGLGRTWNFSIRYNF